MHPEQQALDGFLFAIAADPTDDVSHRAMADWLEESGQSAAAELIRLSLVLEEMDTSNPRYVPMEARIRELEPLALGFWFPNGTPDGADFELDRGVPVEVIQQHVPQEEQAEEEQAISTGSADTVTNSTGGSSWRRLLIEMGLYAGSAVAAGWGLSKVEPPSKIKPNAARFLRNEGQDSKSHSQYTLTLSETQSDMRKQPLEYLRHVKKELKKEKHYPALMHNRKNGEGPTVEEILAKAEECLLNNASDAAEQLRKADDAIYAFLVGEFRIFYWELNKQNPDEVEKLYQKTFRAARLLHDLANAIAPYCSFELKIPETFGKREGYCHAIFVDLKGDHLRIIIGMQGVGCDRSDYGRPGARNPGGWDRFEKGEEKKKEYTIPIKAFCGRFINASSKTIDIIIGQDSKGHPVHIKTQYREELSLRGLARQLAEEIEHIYQKNPGMKWAWEIPRHEMRAAELRKDKTSKERQ